ncbi:TetR/AcrR family transcriptional regulator [Paenarthrobacter ureafaciens]|uniref:TetR/AcrR family transcriptional regulator n=1 Tax=Paenarthrobacter ureafaciens TaxID=37931 RepID=UPI00140C7549|nr:TetR/AcrR family transcriptional regulator [Paenarthrobacter ureafaciens]MCX8454736.1 TetR/AcrR family transcriptional regulator [Paenarthrobacter ureafaciens]MCY0973542.1 TetR/AcrR family transcriptional regulator [Paenarthrobacter ureafaciens]
MVRKTSDAAVHSGSWQWSRTATTQRKLLDAAAAVFSELGFTDAGISDIVTRAGSSVGSLYHHFGGKTEIFLALWDDYQNEHERLVAAAVAKARKSGENDPLTLFNVGSRTYFDYTWKHRALERVFFEGDAPPGFELLRRERGREWVRQNSVLLRTAEDTLGRLTVAVITDIITVAGHEVALSATKKEADDVVDAAAVLVARLVR